MFVFFFFDTLSGLFGRCDLIASHLAVLKMAELRFNVLALNLVSRIVASFGFGGVAKLENQWIVKKSSVLVVISGRA